MRNALILLTLLAAGCSHVARLEEGQRAPRAEDAPVEMFVTNMPERPYVEVAMTQQASKMRELADTIKDLKIQARKLGCDAVLVKRSPSNYDVIDAIFIAWKP